MPQTTLTDRAVLRLSGEDVRGFLQGLVTNDTALLAPDRPLWAGLLSAQGKALFDFFLWTQDPAPDGDILIDCEATQADALLRRLTIYRLRRPITLTRDDTLAVHWSTTATEGVPDPRLPALGHRWLAPPGAPAPAAPAPAAPAIGWREHRLRLGVTEGIAELGNGETLWLECNARELNGVSFTKGCYVGQENTARMHHRAKVNRRLVVAPLTDPTDRTRTTYPELGLMIELRRVEALGDALVPEWLATSA